MRGQPGPQHDAPSYLNPVWSPDGGMIAFESNRDKQKFAVYTIRRDGSGLRKLTSGESDDAQPQWRPDGRSIVFVSNRDGHDQIYAMAPNGAGQTKVVSTPRDDYFGPQFSADGRWILFAGQSAANRALYYVCVMRADGSEMRVVSDTLASAEEPVWTRDGAYVSYLVATATTRDSGETPRAFMQRRRASMRRMLVPLAGGAAQPAPEDSVLARHGLSPDGRWELRVAQRNGLPAIAIVEVATGAERVLIGGGH